jgi:DNA polymerase III gamma/tau subunit
MILKDEGIKADDEVIAQVARLGNGSMRDALSILDRLLAGGNDKLSQELLEQMLGLPDHAIVNELVDAIIAGDPKAALDRGAQLLINGASVEQALELLTEHFRNLMVIATCGDNAELLDLSDEHRRAAAAQAKHFDAPGLVHMIAICDAVARNARGSTTSRALFDAALVRLSSSQHFADIAALLNGAKPPSEAIAKPAFRTTATPDSKKKEQALIDQPSSTSEDTVAIDLAPAVAPSPTPGSFTEVKSIADDQLWPTVLEVAARIPADRQRTEHLIFQSFDGRTLRLAVDENGADIAPFLTTSTDRLVDLVKRATGRTVHIVLDTSRVESSVKPSTIGAGPSNQPHPPIVQKAIELFDAVVVSVEDVAAKRSSSS